MKGKLFGTLDRAERQDLKSRLMLWLSFSPFLFLPKRRKKKRRINSKNRDFKSCLYARSNQHLNPDFLILNDLLTNIGFKESLYANTNLNHI